ncbi:MAG: AMP-binding protein, partial [Bacteroidales bacterium]|nr:AMP-binding protein [Bacteroidales bacterium]
MTQSSPLTFPAIFSETVRKYGQFNAMTFVGEKPINYNEVKSQIDSLIVMLEKLSIKPGDRVAILSNNMPNWGITYFAVTFMGCVIVPLLPDFSPPEIENILNHSEAKAIFVSENLESKLSTIKNKFLKSRVKIEDFSIIDTGGEAQYSFIPGASSASNYQVEEDDLAAIIYTSGTTGKSKGVMLSHKNICFNAEKAKVVQNVTTDDRFLSILPLSHTYENTLGLILPMLGGSCIYYLRKPPTPSILLPALKEVKPTLMLSVPLIIEKIYFNKILPAFTEKRIMRSLYKIPLIRKKLNLVAGKKLMKTFGDELVFFGIGGARLSKTVEEFLLEAKFPYAIGYGLTETSPLLAGVNAQNTRLQSTGPSIEGMQIKINNPDKATGEGEIWAKGPSIMKGYYKEPELTGEVITKDGWFKTGDLGIFDKDNYLYIKGRIKDMIIGSSGENIYPTDIESVINTFGHVVESLVIQKEGKLVARVHFNREEIAEHYKYLKEEFTGYVDHKINELSKELQEYVNIRVNKFSRIQIVIEEKLPFQKTATQKIKRFL